PSGDGRVDARAGPGHDHRGRLTVERDRVRGASAKIQVKKVDPIFRRHEDVVVLIAGGERLGRSVVVEILRLAGCEIDLLRTGLADDHHGVPVAACSEWWLVDRRLVFQPSFATNGYGSTIPPGPRIG